MKQKTKELVAKVLGEYNLPDFEKRIGTVIEAVAAFKPYNKILICGNGGSAADSQHIVGELMKSFCAPRPPDLAFTENFRKLYGEHDLLQKTQGAVRAISLVSETALITAVCNDLGADYMYSQPAYGYTDAGDLLFAFSTSGNSKAVINACMVAKAKGAVVVGFTGRSGGRLKDYCDILLNADDTETFKIQQIHEILYHALCLGIEAEIFGE
jgi:D-sedoheptulose 7-phosphate isomerase